MVEELEIEYKIEEKDYLHFRFTQIIPEKFRRIGNILFSFALFCFLINPILMPLTLGREVVISDFIPQICIIGLAGLFYYRTKQGFRANSDFQSKIKLRVTINDVSLEGKGFTSKFDWSKVSMVREKKNYFLIYTSDHIALIVSKAGILPEKIKALDNIFESIPNLDYKSFTKS